MSEIDRRFFLSQGALATIGLWLCGCSADAATAPAAVSGSVRIADHTALATIGGVALVTVDGNRLAIVRTGASSFIALSRICPHQGNIINPSTEGFLCTGHGARFNTTGSWIGGQETSNMRSYTVVYNETAGTLRIG